ncbi:DUF4177 domain-containing protein [Jannaschia sp. W003]|uniref:DUF4177 domain-containing protein n=1 Tax=Jannaschia sp. W003 TaxID=2867012 RepID=UPI0021A2F8B8|nr:DUF4177 domain-containing protein [Jannaschia sp. W003]UWQ21064.1 DUF4177 domain-containing protein [Jannaschia sp. W003]
MDASEPLQTFEYRVVPAPRKGERARGVRSGEARFALAMTRLFNRMGREGWEFVRADTLPAEERVGLLAKELRYHTLLVFRRAVAPPVAVAALAPPAPPPLRLPSPEWLGFEDEAIDDAEVVHILARRRPPGHAAE